MWPSWTGDGSGARPGRALLAALGLALGANACATAPAPGGATADRPAVFYPDPPDEPRVQFLTSFSDSSPFLPEQQANFRQFLLGAAAPEVQHIVKPYGVAMQGENIFVCDTMLGVVHVFDMENMSYAQIGREGRGNLQKPINLTLGPDGTRYVADVGRGQIVVFDANNTFLREIGNREEFRPTGCTLVGDELFVVDVKDHEVERRDPVSGRVLGRFGGRGSELGELFKPTNISRDAAGRIYVTDTINCRIQIFDQDGNVLEAFGEQGDLLGQFVRPKGVAVGPDGMIYVVDAAFENVQIFGQDTQLYLFFGGPGQSPGDMLLPAGITISRDGVEYFRDYIDPNFDAEYLIIVANGYGTHRVSIYAKGLMRKPE